MTILINIVQHNLIRLRIASHQLADMCEENNIDVVLIQEPVVTNGKVVGFEMHRQLHTRNKAEAAIIIMNRDLPTISLEQHNSDNTVAARIGTRDGSVTLVSSYFRYSMPTNVFIEQIRPILDEEPNAVIGADVNGHSGVWHCQDTNDRGRAVEHLLEDYKLHAINVAGNMNTYDRPGMGTSNIDVILATKRICAKIENWTVRDITDSDH